METVRWRVVVSAIEQVGRDKTTSAIGQVGRDKTTSAIGQLVTGLAAVSLAVRT